MDKLKAAIAHLEELRARGMDLPDPEALHRAHVDVTLALADVVLAAAAPYTEPVPSEDPPIVEAIIEPGIERLEDEKVDVLADGTSDSPRRDWTGE